MIPRGDEGRRPLTLGEAVAVGGALLGAAPPVALGVVAATRAGPASAARTGSKGALAGFAGDLEGLGVVVPAGPNPTDYR